MRIALAFACMCCCAAALGIIIGVFLLQLPREREEEKSHASCTRLGACTLTNFCHDHTSIFPAYPIEPHAAYPLQLSSFPGSFTIRGVYERMTDPVWFTPASAAPRSVNLSLAMWRSTLWIYAPAAWPHLRVAHLMLGGWAPLFFSLLAAGGGEERKDLLVFQSGTLEYRVSSGTIEQPGGCIPRELHASYRHLMPALRDIRCAGDVTNGAGRTVTRLTGGPMGAVRCYRTVHAGLPVTADVIMRSANHSGWQAFREAFGPSPARSAGEGPNIFVISRKALGLQAFGNRMFTDAAISGFHAMLERLQRERLINRYLVDDMGGDTDLMSQGTAFSQWDIVIGVHGNGFGWTPLLPRTSWIIILCRATELSYCDFYGLVARSSGCNRANYPVPDLNTPTLVAMERELRETILPKWRARVEGESYTIK